MKSSHFPVATQPLNSIRALSMALTMVLTACGGGGGDAPPPALPVPEVPPTPKPEAPPAPLPTALSIAPVAPADDVANTLQFKPSNDTSVAGLSYIWSFGDGGTSTLPEPRYKYAKAGAYTVELKISNSAGQARSASYSVSLDNKTHLAGLSCGEPNQGGWCKVYPNEDTYAIQYVQFISPKVGWTVLRKVNTTGEVADLRFVLQRTTDGGKTWVPSGQVTGKPLDHFWAIDEAKALVWTSTDLIVTQDGGLSWEVASYDHHAGKEILRTPRGLIRCPDCDPSRGIPSMGWSV